MFRDKQAFDAYWAEDARIKAWVRGYGLPVRLVRSLHLAGYVTPELVGEASDHSLLRMQNVGPVLCAALRAAIPHRQRPLPAWIHEE